MLFRSGAHHATAHFIFHPEVKLKSVTDDECLLEINHGKVIKIKVLIGRPKIESANYAPEFGKVLPTQKLAVQLIEGFSKIQIILL